MMDHPSLNDLPDDVLLEVFSWLPVGDMVTCALYVCERWRRLFRFHALWRGQPPYETEKEEQAEEAYQMARIVSSVRNLTLEFGYEFRLRASEDEVIVRWDVFQQEKFEFLTDGACVENLNIQGSFVAWSNVTSLAKCLPQLKSLDVSNGVMDWPCEELPEALERLLGSGLLRELRSLSVSGASSQSVELDNVLLAASKGCPQIEELQLEWTDRLTQRGLAGVAACTHLRRLCVASVRSPVTLKFLPTGLQELKVSCCPKVELDLFGSGCDECPQLRSLALESCALMGSQLMEVAQRLTVLEEVNLSGNRTLADLSFLRSWPHLQSLNLSNCKKFYGTSFQALGFLKDLKTLNLSRCNLQNVCLDVIGSLIHLQELFLAGTYVSRGQALAASLPPSLRVLDVCRCEWVDATVVWELRHLRQLKTLLLSRCYYLNGWEHLAGNILPRLSALESLDLSGIGIACGGFLRDLSFLRFCPQLIELDVGESSLAPVTFIDLKYVPGLQRLNLRGMFLKNFPFCETVGQLTELKILTIYGCTGIGEGVVRGLHHFLPKLKVEGRPQP